ncbi:MAG: hypothetical protein AAGD04_13470 [Pseudomonadota bacterium]
MKVLMAGLLAFVLLGGCRLQEAYTPPEADGLVGLRAYPNEGDVCEVLGESPETLAYLDHTALLIGCPWHERGAIRDRQREGAEIVDRVGAWVLLSLPIEGAGL